MKSFEEFTNESVLNEGGKASKDIINQARKLGEQAAKDGKKSTPIADEKLMKLIEDNSKGDKQFGWTIKVFDAWANAWHKQNLK